MDPNPSQHDAHEPVIPAGLSAELRVGHAHRGDLSGLDEAVMGMARRELGKRTPRGVLARVGGVGGSRWVRGSAAAAVLAIGVWGGWMFLGRSGPVAGSGMNSIVSAPSEHVTILDAFALARMLEARQKNTTALAIPAAWDVDGNGVIDQRDVDAIAQRAVKLSSVGTASPARGAADTSPERRGGLGTLAARQPSLRSGLVNTPAIGGGA